MTTPKSRPSIVHGESHSYPVLPLRDIVVFPHMIVPLFVGREKSIRALEEVVISREVVEGTARPLYIYADRSDRAVESSASA